MLRLLPVILLIGCAHLYTPIDVDEDARPAHDNAYSDGHLPGSMVAKTILGSGAISLLGPGSSSASPTFTKVTLQTLQIPVGGGLAGNGCLGYSSSDNICFNPNQMDISATAGINLNVSSGGAVNFAGSTSVDATGNLAVRSNLLQVNGTQVLARSNSLTQFSVGTAGTPWLDVQSTGIAASVNLTESGAFISTNANSTAFQASGSGGKFAFTNTWAQNTAPTISSGFGSSPSIVASNGSLAFQINVGTGGVATSGVIGLPTAATGWVCKCDDITTENTTVTYTKQTASSTTSCTVANFTDIAGSGAWVASDKLNCIAVAY